jgi:dipeptidase E
MFHIWSRNKVLTMQLLLLSNSTMPGAPYLTWPIEHIKRMLAGKNSALFIPYAAVKFSYDKYEEMVKGALSDFVAIKSIHHSASPVEAVQDAEAILVGGGNTFHLLHELYRYGLIDPIRKKAKAGTPYIGWSAGSNVACMSIKTTNDMPIIQPPSFDALQLFPYQINPHYTELTIAGHGGETRLQRLEEYASINNTPVICLPEGCAIEVNGSITELIASKPCKVLGAQGKVLEIAPGGFSLAG